ELKTRPSFLWLKIHVVQHGNSESALIGTVAAHVTGGLAVYGREQREPRGPDELLRLFGHVLGRDPHIAEMLIVLVGWILAFHDNDARKDNEKIPRLAGNTSQPGASRNWNLEWHAPILTNARNLVWIRRVTRKIGRWQRIGHVNASAGRCLQGHHE